MKNKPKTVSIIISTYNWPKALKKVLESVAYQTIIPDEVIIADDGSKKDTKQVIDLFMEKHPNINTKHIWHEDKGFRLSEIRNKALKEATSEYIIQIDGDVILNKYFVKDHINKADTNFFIVGSRVLLDDYLSKKILENNSSFNIFSKGLKNKFNSLRFPFLSHFFEKSTKELSKVVKSVRGCNMSFWRKDLIKINGYNENMTGWGREDSELSVRLLNNGISKKKIKLIAIQYHLYHKENKRERLNINDEILENTIKNNKTKCSNGIVKL